MPIRKDAATLNLPPEFIRKFYLELLNALILPLQHPTDTAILIFSRTAEEEAMGKKYGHGRRKNIRVAGQLIAHTLRVAGSSGLPVIKKYSRHQRGKNFGERLVNAIEDVFAQGYSRVITIGTDTPGITSGIIKEINAGLQLDSFITGPSADGGVYAIGMAREGWDRAAFLRIAWETSNVQKELEGYAFLCGLGHKSLTVLNDIDSGPDFAAWMHNTGWHHRLVRLIRTLLNTGWQLLRTICVTPLCPCDMQVARRGPPVAALA